MKLGRSHLDVLFRARRLGGWARWNLGLRDAPAVGRPPAQITVLTSSGRKALSTKRARSGGTPGRLDHQERTDDRSE